MRRDNLDLQHDATVAETVVETVVNFITHALNRVVIYSASTKKRPAKYNDVVFKILGKHH